MPSDGADVDHMHQWEKPEFVAITDEGARANRSDLRIRNGSEFSASS